MLVLRQHSRNPWACCSRPIYRGTWGFGFYGLFQHMPAFIEYVFKKNQSEEREEGQGEKEKGSQNPYAAELGVMGVSVWRCSDVEKTTPGRETCKQKGGKVSMHQICDYICAKFPSRGGVRAENVSALARLPQVICRQNNMHTKDATTGQTWQERGR